MSISGLALLPLAAIIAGAAAATPDGGPAPDAGAALLALAAAEAQVQDEVHRGALRALTRMLRSLA
jgi:hypothetical protein